MLLDFLQHALTVGVFTIQYILYYQTVNHFFGKSLKLKQKAYIISIKSSFLLSCIGIYFNFFSTHSKFDVILSKLTINHFTAYLIMDLYYGNNDYRPHTNFLQTYIHHTAYIIVNQLALYNDLSMYYIYYFILEVPTFILGVGSFSPSLRHDTLFGYSFLFTRILYHLYLTFCYFNITTVFYLSNLAFGLHVYWFNNWVKKYGKESLHLDTICLYFYHIYVLYNNFFYPKEIDSSNKQE